jgi:uncharacterized protein YccT (UPF0319 family)
MCGKLVACVLSILVVTTVVLVANVTLLLSNNKKMDQSILELKHNLSKIMQDNNQLNETSMVLSAEIRDIHIVELAKP